MTQAVSDEVERVMMLVERALDHAPLTNGQVDTAMQHIRSYLRENVCAMRPQPSDEVAPVALAIYRRHLELFRPSADPKYFDREDAWELAVAAVAARPHDPDVKALVDANDEIARLKQERLMLLATLYSEVPKFVATICDTKMDRSGALLGEVRALNSAALAPFKDRGMTR